MVYHSLITWIAMARAEEFKGAFPSLVLCNPRGLQLLGSCHLCCTVGTIHSISLVVAQSIEHLYLVFCVCLFLHTSQFTAAFHSSELTLLLLSWEWGRE